MPFRHDWISVVRNKIGHLFIYSSYVDVKAELDDNSRVIIEIQVLNHEGLEKRILYNAAKNYSVQLKKGDAYYLLNPVIALTITDFILFKNTEELIFIELPKYHKTEAELDTVRDK